MSNGCIHGLFGDKYCHHCYENTKKELDTMKKLVSDMKVELALLLRESAKNQRMADRKNEADLKALNKKRAELGRIERW